MITCPRCGLDKMQDDGVLNSLSRRDNETYICNDCGTDEAMIDYVVSESLRTGKRTQLQVDIIMRRESAWLDKVYNNG